MALLVIATVTARPGSEPEVETSMLALVEPTRAEQGCITYQVFRSEINPTVFLTVEQWRDQDAFNAHMQTPHMVRISGTTDGTVAVEPVMTWTLRSISDRGARS